MTQGTQTFGPGPFGQKIGQRKHGYVPCTRGSGWYDKNGHWIGWGDLTREDMMRIAREIPEGERVIVLHEEDSYRRFLKVLVRDPSREFRNEDEPGLEYLSAHVLFVIESHTISRVDHVHPRRDEPSVDEGVTFRIIDKNEAAALVMSAAQH